MRLLEMMTWHLLLSLTLLVLGQVNAREEEEEALPDLATLFKTLFKADLDDFLAEADAKAADRTRLGLDEDSDEDNSGGEGVKRHDLKASNDKHKSGDLEETTNNNDENEEESSDSSNEKVDNLKESQISSTSFSNLSASQFGSLIIDLRQNRPAQPSLIRRTFIYTTDQMDALADVSRRIAFAKQHHLHSSTKCPARKRPECDASRQVPTLDGRCNNLAHPFWGSSLQPFRRLLRPDYGDHFITPRGAKYKLGKGYTSKLPNARSVSANVHSNKNVSDSSRTHLFMQFGQFVDHDITATAKEDLACCARDARLLCACFPISLEHDEHFSALNRSCMQFTRSSTNCRAESKFAEQFNGVSSFLDLSQVYGTSIELNKKLRMGNRDGLLAKNPRFGAFDLPRRSHVGLGHPHLHRSVDDFAAGDTRANSQPTLLALHNVWLREHNRVASNLARRLRKSRIELSDERFDQVIFGVARKALLAEYQNIIYSEFLPNLLGEEVMRRRRLGLKTDSEYDQNRDATATNEFATAAFRYGHSSVQAVFQGRSQPWRLSRGLGSAHFAIRNGGQGFENEMAGAAGQKQQRIDGFVTDELTNKLFANERLLGNKKAADGAASDLIATNIQRGRDHGLPGYNFYRELAALSRISDMNDRPQEISEEDWSKIRKVYRRPGDIDLYSGGLLEKHVEGGAVGPTFAFIIGEQFEALKYGDRFFFTHNEASSRGLPKSAQKVAMRRRMSDVLCDNVPSIKSIQRNVFRTPDADRNEIIRCSDKSKRGQFDFDRIVENIVRALKASREQKSERKEETDEDVVTLTNESVDNEFNKESNESVDNEFSSDIKIENDSEYGSNLENQEYQETEHHEETVDDLGPEIIEYNESSDNKNEVYEEISEYNQNENVQDNDEVMTSYDSENGESNISENIGDSDQNESYDSSDNKEDNYDSTLNAENNDFKEENNNEFKEENDNFNEEKEIGSDQTSSNDGNENGSDGQEVSMSSEITDDEYSSTSFNDNDAENYGNIEEYNGNTDENYGNIRENQGNNEENHGNSEIIMDESNNMDENEFSDNESLNRQEFSHEQENNDAAEQSSHETSETEINFSNEIDHETHQSSDKEQIVVNNMDEIVNTNNEYHVENGENEEFTTSFDESEPKMTEETTNIEAKNNEEGSYGSEMDTNSNFESETNDFEIQTSSNEINAMEVNSDIDQATASVPDNYGNDGQQQAESVTGEEVNAVLTAIADEDNNEVIINDDNNYEGNVEEGEQSL